MIVFHRLNLFFLSNITKGMPDDIPFKLFIFNKFNEILIKFLF